MNLDDDGPAFIERLQKNTQGSLHAALLDLRKCVRDIAMKVDDADAMRLNDAADLLRVLANITNEMDIKTAFGAPGDWGYDNPIGRGVLQLHRKVPT